MSTAEAAAVPVPHLAPAPPAPPAQVAPLLLEALPEGLLEGVRLPLPYRFALPVPNDPRLSAQRTAADPEHGGAVMACSPFYKPLSRCVGGRP
jgi:hypothetical protein